LTCKRDLQKRPTKETYKFKKETIHRKKPASNQTYRIDLQKRPAKETYKSKKETIHRKKPASN